MKKEILTTLDMLIKSSQAKTELYFQQKNNYELNKIYKNIKTLNPYSIEIDDIVLDDLGDPTSGNLKTPKEKEQLKQYCKYNK